MEYDIAVIGGGISGLSLAHGAARRGWRVLLLEAEPRVGGALHTHRREGFWMELGAHTLFNSYGTVLAMMDVAGLTGRVLRRRRLAFRLWNGTRDVSIAASLHYPELLRGMLRAPFLHRSEHTAADYFGALAGPRNFTDVIGPALDAVICQPARDFPADVLFQRKPRRREVPRSFALPGGMASLADSLAASPGVQVLSSMRVTRLAREGGGFRLFAAGADWRADRIALAVPPNEAAMLLAAVRPGLSEQLLHIGVARVESLGVVVRARDAQLPAVAGLIGRGQPFYSVVSRDVVPGGEWRGFTFHFRPGALGHDDKLRVAARVIGTAAENFEDVVASEHVLPALRSGHASLRGRIDALLARTPVLLTGNYFEGLSIEACAARSMAELQRPHG
ncbi:MAG: NAD(P)/FAD-dependent oxidoreductase [Thiohalomonadaceae bacterium]